jgi:hypothetical protein
MINQTSQTNIGNSPDAGRMFAYFVVIISLRFAISASFGRCPTSLSRFPSAFICGFRFPAFRFIRLKKNLSTHGE